LLTEEKLKEMILTIKNLDNIGCTYDFKDQFEVALTSLEALNLVTKISSKIPDCDEHCLKSNDCQWFSIYQKQKSKSKFKLTKTGEKFANDILENNLTSAELKSIILDVVSKALLVDTIQSVLIEQKNLTIEKLVTEILKQTNIDLRTIRIALMDILHLMESLEIIHLKEGLILTYV